MHGEDFNKWLKSLKVGDKIVRSAQYGNGLGDLCTISRETSTRFYYKSSGGFEDWFYKETGCGPFSGGRFRTRHTFRPFDPEMEQNFARRDTIKRIGDLYDARSWTKFGIKQLVQIEQALKPLDVKGKT